jgi:hypothetical protein
MTNEQPRAYFKIPLKKGASNDARSFADIVSQRAAEMIDANGTVDAQLMSTEIVITIRSAGYVRRDNARGTTAL